MFDAALDYLRAYFLDVGSTLLFMPVDVGEKFYLIHIGTFIALAYLSFRKYYRHRTKRGFWRFVFPKEIYNHKSAKVDYGIFLINVLLSPLLFAGAALQAWISTQVGGGLIDLNGGQAIVTGDWGWWTYALFILGFTLAADLAVYLVHRLHHQSDFLWPLHALHHSAEVMTPVTLFRKHPLWNILAKLMHVILTGLFQGAFLFVFFGNPGVEVLFGLNSIYVLYNFFGANLRHSHIWLHWGNTLGHVFISPAMHQIHHDPERMNKNYGEVFAIWDWLFGTLYVPQEYERFDIGLGKEGNPHDSLAKAYYVPVLDSAQVLLNKLRVHRQES